MSILSRLLTSLFYFKSSYKRRLHRHFLDADLIAKSQELAEAEKRDMLASLCLQYGAWAEAKVFLEDKRVDDIHLGRLMQAMIAYMGFRVHLPSHGDEWDLKRRLAASASWQAAYVPEDAPSEEARDIREASSRQTLAMLEELAAAFNGSTGNGMALATDWVLACINNKPLDSHPGPLDLDLRESLDRMIIMRLLSFPETVKGCESAIQHALNGDLSHISRM